MVIPSVTCKQDANKQEQTAIALKVLQLLASKFSLQSTSSSHTQDILGQPAQGLPVVPVPSEGKSAMTGYN